MLGSCPRDLMIFFHSLAIQRAEFLIFLGLLFHMYAEVNHMVSTLRLLLCGPCLLFVPVGFCSSSAAACPRVIVVVNGSSSAHV